MLVGVVGIRHTLRGIVNDDVQVVYRCDTRPPEEIIYNLEGFRPRGNNINLDEHLFTNSGDSAYVSTTTDPMFAAQWKGSGSYVYMIRLRNSISSYDINSLYGSGYINAAQQEIAVLGGIDVSDIIGWVKVGDLATFTTSGFSKNPFFVDREDIIVENESIIEIPFLRHDGTKGVATVRYMQYPVQLRITADDSTYTELDSIDLFTALGKIRTRLESIGIRLMCNGSASNVFVSGMQSQMTAGLYASMVIPGKQQAEQVNIFEPNMNIDYATVEKQREFVKKLMNNLRKS